MTILQDEVFKAIAVLGGEDIRELSRREIDDLLSAHAGAREYLNRRAPSVIAE